MKVENSTIYKWVQFIFFLSLLIGLYLTSLYNYLLFHSLAEIFSIIVACGIFMVAWNSRKFMDNNYLLFVGIAYLFIALLDLIHTLAYSGMPIFQGYGANLPTQLWINARYMESLSLFLAPMFLSRQMKHNIVFSIYFAVFSLVLFSVFEGIFPACFIEGTGLTPFKIISEYIIGLILLGAIIKLYKNRREFDNDILILLIVSICLTILGELAFTFYISAYGISNLVGHYLKIASFFLIYKALISAGLKRPYDFLFRNLKKNAEYHQSIINTAMDGFWLTDTKGNILEVNESYCRMSGYSKAELINMRISDVEALETGDDISLRTHNIISQGGDRFQSQHKRKNGSVFDVEVSVQYREEKGGRVVCFLHDITEQKQSESERESTIEILEILNSKSNLRDLMQSLIHFMQKMSDCEAMGIRLQDGEDFPYYETHGFPDDFVIAERHLCTRDLDGQLLRDEVGNPVLECMCGNIICGRFDPAIPFFTKFGSFVSNGTTKLLASSTEEDRQARTRNRCNAEGYESVFIVPLRSGGETFGLLQFNDRRENCFSPQFISQIERMAGNVAIALSQRKSNEALRESLERLKGFDLHSSEGVYRIDMAKPVPLDLAAENMRDWINRHAVVGDVNDSLARMYGLTPQDMIGQAATDFAPNYSERAMLVLDRTDRRVTNQETEDVDLDGNPLYLVENYHGIVENGHLHAIWGAQRDITDRKLAETALWDSNERLQKVFDSQLDAIFILDSQRPPHILSCNEAVCTIFGYTLEEIQGETTDQLHVDAGHLKEFQDVLGSAIKKEGYLQNFEFKMKRKDNSIFPSGHTVMELIDDTGVRTGWISVVSDLTERKKADALLQQAQKMESIGNLAGGIAHDFNNLLFPIIGMSEILLEDLPQDSLEHENAQEIFHAGRRAGDLVNQILAFSRQSEHKMTPVRVQNVLEEVLKLSRSTIPTNIEIQQNIQQNCGLIMADTTQIHQVAMNLITNAYHAVEDKNGVIDIELKEIIIEQEEVPVKELLSGKYVRLSVSDSGIGMDQSTINKIFEPYFTTKEKGKGTGLGLAVVYGIVKEHNGDIKVYSESGKGTTFCVYLPLMKKATEAVPAEQISELATGAESVLLVDDEVSVAKLEGQMLSRLGYQVTVKTNSGDALNAFRSNPDSFDLVISDMTMPDMTGDQLSKEILSIKPDIPIIICTGFSERINKEQAEMLGVKGFLMKPVIKSDMGKMVRNVLDEAKNT